MLSSEELLDFLNTRKEQQAIEIKQEEEIAKSLESELASLQSKVALLKEEIESIRESQRPRGDEPESDSEAAIRALKTIASNFFTGLVHFDSSRSS